MSYYFPAMHEGIEDPYQKWCRKEGFKYGYNPNSYYSSTMYAPEEKPEPANEPEAPKSDPVDHPDHYNHGTIECIDYLRDTLGDGFQFYLEGNVKKYLHRWRYKGGLEDLRKADWYLDLLIEEFGNE